VVARGEHHAHRSPGGEGLGQEPPGVRTGPLVLVEVAADGDHLAVAPLGLATGAPQGVAKALTAPSGEVSVAPHAGEGAVEVKVSEVEEA